MKGKINRGKIVSSFETLLYQGILSDISQYMEKSRYWDEANFSSSSTVHGLSPTMMMTAHGKGDGFLPNGVPQLGFGRKAKCSEVRIHSSLN
ncbi:hypothetical protein EK904_006110 [Melospiza melodia maxima]|nr:hypothetical protein EK904_006110 [Melospiza melodia maxima]